MKVIVNEAEIVVEPPKPQQTTPQAAAQPQTGEKSRLRPDDLARIREQQRRRLRRILAD